MAIVSRLTWVLEFESHPLEERVLLTTEPPLHPIFASSLFLRRSKKFPCTVGSESTKCSKVGTFGRPRQGMPLREHATHHRVSVRGLLGDGESERMKGHLSGDMREADRAQAREAKASERTVSDGHFMGCLCCVADDGKAPGGSLGN